jgi:hypothetical protein
MSATLETVEPIARVLSTEIPGLSNLGIHVTLADIADKLLGTNAVQDGVDLINTSTNSPASAR